MAPNISFSIIVHGQNYNGILHFIRLWFVAKVLKGQLYMPRHSFFNNNRCTKKAQKKVGTFSYNSINFVQWLIFMGGLGANLFLYTSHKPMDFQCNYCNQIVVVSIFSKVGTEQGGLRSLYRSGQMPKWLPREKQAFVLTYDGKEPWALMASRHIFAQV